MPAINISNIVVGCAGSTDGTGTVSFDFSSALSGGSFQIKLSGDGPTYGPTPVASASGDGSGSFTGVADGVYQITVIHSGGTTGSTAQNITVSCAAPPAVDCSAFEWLNEANAVTDWADTGNLDLDFAALAGTDQGSLASVVLNPGNIAATSIAVVGGLSRAKFDALPAGSYSFLATTSEGCTLTGNLVLPLYGCIDPLASTYNPLANAQDPDVPCVPWPAATPVFTIPACQSLSFVPQSAAADNCTYPDPTRVLFNTADRNRQEADEFAQRVSPCDVLKIQLWSSYPYNRIVVSDAEETAVLTALAAGALFYTDQEANAVAATLTAHPTDATLAILGGTWTTLPAWAVVGALVELIGTASGQDDTYRIVAVDKWARTAHLKMHYTGPAADPVTCNIVYDAAAYNIYEAMLNFLAVLPGCYNVRAEGSNAADFSTVVVTWQGEPINVAEFWPDCHRLEWTNRDNFSGVNYGTGIIHRRRIPAILHENGHGGEVETMRDCDNALVNLGGFVTDTVKWQTTWVPPYLSRVLARAFAHDGLWIDGEEYRTEEVYRTSTQKGYALETGDIVLERALSVDTNRTDDGSVITPPSNQDHLEYNALEYN